jgi:hypothetical protein
MPTLFFLSVKSDKYSDFAEKLPKKDIKYVGIFYPAGEPILLGGVGWQLRCSSFVVAHYNFIGHSLASANARVGWRASVRE